MCMAPKVPPPPPPPAQRQAMKAPENKSLGGDPMQRRRGYAALISRATPSLNTPMTTSTLGG